MAFPFSPLVKDFIRTSARWVTEKRPYLTLTMSLNVWLLQFKSYFLQCCPYFFSHLSDNHLLAKDSSKSVLQKRCNFLKHYCTADSVILRFFSNPFFRAVKIMAVADTHYSAYPCVLGRCPKPYMEANVVNLWFCWTAWQTLHSHYALASTYQYICTQLPGNDLSLFFLLFHSYLLLTLLAVISKKFTALILLTFL